MGLLQKAVETYDCHQAYVGKYRDGHTVLAPICHIVTRANLEITLNQDGLFCAACAVDKDAPKIIIPATEASAGRTSGICAHPLCDQLGYLAPDKEEKHAAYMEQLRNWEASPASHPKLHPILRYLEGGTIIPDLLRCDLITWSQADRQKEDKLLVRWRIIGLEDEQPDACWEDTTLFSAFIQYYSTQYSNAPEGLCLVSGETCRIAEQHPKGIIPINGNAKLISSNDKTGFTYLGRFTAEEQAAQVGYEASQKAHNALRWLASEQGAQAIYGGRTFLCWNPQGRKVPLCTGSFFQSTKAITKPSEYREQLQQTLRGFQSSLPQQAGVVIAAFDAATSGRLALTYYQELLGSDFLKRLHDWDASCCWPNGKYGIQSPGLRQIVNGAFGTQQSEKGKIILKTDDRVLCQQMQRLVACRIDKAPMPTDLIKALYHRASTPLAYDPNIRRTLLFTACAVIRKYRSDKFKEEWSMNLEPTKADRSYQFGRLLAVLEKVERDTYGSDEEREPNAIRQQSVFCQRPLYAANNMERQLERAYFPRLKPNNRAYYKRLIGQIMEEISAFPQEQWNLPLTETYLMGYYLQRNALYTAKEHGTTEDEENG